MPSLYLIRHCRTTTDGALLGQSDPPLLCRSELPPPPLCPAVLACYVSPLQRARQTATYLGFEDPLVMDSLREIDYGEWNGLLWNEIETRWPALAAAKLERWKEVDAPRGEPWRHFLARVQNALHQMAAGPKPAAVISHQGVNAMLHHLMTGSDPLQFKQAHGEIIHVEFD